jgi:ribose-phosphate pyrophosphokinase
MELKVVVGSASEELGTRVCRELGIDRVTYLRSDYPDGELAPVVCGPLRGDDVYLLQSTSPPVERNLFELLLLADACRREGAARITAVIPYFGYARQDRRTAPGVPLAAAVVGALLRAAPIDRLVVVDPHTPALEAIVGLPCDRLSAVHDLAARIAPVLPDRPVIVAPDLGAVKLAHHFGRELGAPTAVVHKERLSGDAVRTHAVIGDVADRVPIIVDDMISTAGTVVAASRALRAAGAASGLVVAATHGLFTDPAPRRLLELAPDLLLATDTVAPTGFGAVERVSVAEALAALIRAQHDGRPLHDVALYD